MRGKPRPRPLWEPGYASALKVVCSRCRQGESPPFLVCCIVVPSQCSLCGKVPWETTSQATVGAGVLFSGFWRISAGPLIFSRFTLCLFFFSNMCLKTQKMWSLPVSVFNFCCAALYSSDSDNIFLKPHRRDRLRAGAPSFDHVVRTKSSAGRWHRNDQ